MYKSKLYDKCLTIIAISLISIFACTNSEPGGTLDHPLDDYMPHHEKINKAPALANDIDDIEYPELRDYIRSIQNAEKVLSIGGTASGENVQLFGQIDGVVTDSDNNIYILDSKTPALTKYNIKGSLEFIFGGRRGRGPGDLMRPTDIEITDDDRIILADGFGSIKILKTTDEGIEYVTSKESIDWPMDLCFLNNMIFSRIYGQNRAIADSTVFNLVHAFELEDEKYIRSFGLPYQSPRIATNKRYSARGQIACVTSTNTIAYSFEYFPYIYGYTPQGKLKWISELVPFDGYKTQEVVKGGKTKQWKYGSEGGEKERIVSIQPFLDKYLLVQTGAMRSNSSSSYIISSINGELIYHTNTIPRIIHKNEDYYYTKVTEPFLGIEVFKKENNQIIYEEVDISENI